MLTSFAAAATTCEVQPGEEHHQQNGTLHIRHRVFTDIVESGDARIAGVNRPDLDIDLDPGTGTGTLSGRFVLTPSAGGGTWEGELNGRIDGGLVSAVGVARGTGVLDGAILRVDFQQVSQPPGPVPCESPMAFFEMEGLILQRG